MSVFIVRRNSRYAPWRARVYGRLRRTSQLIHRTSIFGKGRWHSVRTFWASKFAGRRRRHIAEASRRRNRA